MTSAVRQVAGHLTRASQTDAELLGRFVADRDGDAFAALVERHGPMVLAVCQRATGDQHAAEDAFQATFAVLARKPATVAPPGAVAGWLHGVARRVGMDARRAALRRSRRERPVEHLPDPPAKPVGDSDLREAVDGELRRLPGKYRDLLVACDLEGRPRRTVAESLGLAEGTLSSRLTVARRMLAERLSRRGLAPVVVAAVAATGLSADASEVPRALLASAARIGSDFPGVVPEGVMALANGAIRAMTIRTCTQWTLAVGLLLAAATAVAFAARPAPVPQATVKHASGGPNRLLFYRTGHLVTSDPDGKDEKAGIKTDDGKVVFDCEDFRLSPDGKRVAVVAYAERPAKAEDFRRTKILVRELTGDASAVDLGSGKVVCWSGDGKEVVIGGVTAGGPGKAPVMTHHIVNLATKARTEVKLPAGHLVSDWSRDGTSFLTTGPTTRDGKKVTDEGVWVMNRDGTGAEVLTNSEKEGVLGRFSPDGKRVLVFRVDTAAASGWDTTLAVIDRRTGKATPVDSLPPDCRVFAYCWGPDGKKIAYTWRKVPPKGERATETESFLVVCDPDGRNAETVATEKAVQDGDAIAGIDWR